MSADGNINPFKYFVAGGFGGVCTVLVGHPLDTIKVRLQTMPPVKLGKNPIYSGTWDCAVKTVKKEGFFGLYKGMAAPITGVAPIFAISFLGFGLGKQLFSPAGDKSENLKPSRLFCAGAFSGIFTAIIMVPGERIKCILQVQEVGSQKYDGPISVIKNLYSEGGIRSLYKGTCATLLRAIITSSVYRNTMPIGVPLKSATSSFTNGENVGSDKTVGMLIFKLEYVKLRKPSKPVVYIPACGVYFTTYELLVRYQKKKNSDGLMNTIFAGGMAGTLNWLIAMPADVLKSRLQTAPEGMYPRGIRDVFAKLYKEEGLKALYAGVTPVMLRAFPANAACFIGVEFGLKAMEFIIPSKKSDKSKPQML